MAAAVQDSRGSAGKKLKKSLKKKKMKMAVKAVGSALEYENKDTDNTGAGRRGSEKGHLSSDNEAIEADNEDEVEPSDDDNDNNAAEGSAGPNAGWAAAMAKILNKKTPRSKPSILVKNKELEKEKQKLKQERLEKRKQLDRKREWEMMCRVKPDVIEDKDTERNFQRIATRGVVQLFNAVQKHQKNVDEKTKEAGGSVRKRAKLLSTVSKKDFISVLRGMDGSTDGRTSATRSSKAKQTEVEEGGPSWTILRDDFMMGASMKDWDKESDGPDGGRPRPGLGSDSDA